MDAEDWVEVAMSDDSLVADLLSRLRRAGHEPPAPPLRLGWSVRQRRSRAPARYLQSDDAAEDVKRIRRKKSSCNKKKEKAEPSRASPTTPLTWSADTSVSGGGSEESSKPAARSKVCIGRPETTISKRPRKKKTLAELREEETLLLKERKKLRKEIESMRLNIQKQRAATENYSRLKLNVQLSCALSASCKKEVEIRESGIQLPDLNLPAESELESHAVLCGIVAS